MKYFFADAHFDHTKAKILRTRPPDFEELWLEILNTSVSKSDTLYLLGDFAFKNPGYWKNRIKCRDLYLILGNHDPGSFGVSAPPSGKCANAFGFRMQQCLDTHVFTERCWLSHYPHWYWPASHRGSFHLYGHVHDQRETTMDVGMPGRRSMDVSPETYKRLFGRWGVFSEQEIWDILHIRPGHDFREFYEASNADQVDKIDGLPGDLQPGDGQ